MTGQVDLLVRGTVVDVLNGVLDERAVAIDDGEIVAFGERPADRELEAEYVAPGLINAHMHVESTMLTLPRYGEAVLPRGVTSIVADPHEIGNVLGVEGVRALASENDRTPLKARFGVPSSVPATDLQDAGATIGPEEVADLCGDDDVIALAEVMDIDALLAGDPDLHAKIDAAREAGLRVDGHLSGITGDDLQAAARYLDNDHESRTLDAGREKAMAGLRLHLRQGSSSKNLDALLPVVDEIDTRRLSLCTDNFYVDDLQRHAGMDEAVRMCIDAGVDPVTAVQMATVNTADAYGLPFGRIAPGAPADLVLLDDLESWDVDRVIVDGELDPTGDLDAERPEPFRRDTVSFPALNPDDLAHPAPGPGEHRVRVIDHTGETTAETVETVPTSDGVLVADTDADVLPAAVIERHGKGGGIGTGFVHGFGLDRGAVASTVAHDAHNLVVVGASHAGMVAAAEHLRAVGGGLAVSDPEGGGDGFTTLDLPIAGLLSPEPASTVADRLAAVDEAGRDLGLSLPGGVMELDNLTLEVIPELRLTNHGLVDVRAGETVDVVLDD